MAFGIRIKWLGCACFEMDFGGVTVVNDPWITANQKTELSFDEPLNTDLDGNELLLSDVLGTDGDLVMRPIEAEVDRQLLHQSIARLEERERQIITMRYGLDGKPERTQKEVAELMGISQSYISRLEKRIIARLKKEILRLLNV